MGSIPFGFILTKIILKKDNVLIGKTNLDISQNILDLYNKKVKKFQLIKNEFNKNSNKRLASPQRTYAFN